MAGQRSKLKLWRVLDILNDNGLRFELAETRRPGHAIELACGSGAHRICVAAGGDGTVAEVTAGLLRSSHCGPATTALGIIPLGTANVLAHELGLSFHPAGVAAALAHGRTRPLWPGVAEEGTERRLFVQMLGAGVDAQVVHRLPAWSKRVAGRGAYGLQTLRELPRYRFQPIRLRLDGTEHQAFSVIVSKGRLYGGAYLLAPGAQPGEPGFSIALFERGGPLPALVYGAALPLDLLPRVPGLRLLRASRVDIEGNAPAQADGDRAGTAPLAVYDSPGPIQVVVG